MSETIWNIMTPFADVAELGQGYMARADGQCLWVPLPNPVDMETEVPFVIYLIDGTPAFAGTGRCIQVADQGAAADPQVRYEALLDSLMFDERSQPVYDYIVAVRAASMEDQGIDVDMDGGQQETALVHEAAAHPPYATATDGPGRDEEPQARRPPPVPATKASAQVEDEDDVLELPASISGRQSFRPAERPIETVLRPSIMPKSSGFLTRPIIGLHFQSVTAHGPARSASTGLFEYPQGDLPVPAQPPRPEGFA